MALLRISTHDRFKLDRKPSNLWVLFGWFQTILGPETAYYWLAMIYGVAISLLTLALPISVQILIDTVANTGLVQPVLVLSGVLGGLLLLSAFLVSLRAHVMEIFGRHLYARLTSEIALRAVHAHNSYFQEGKRDSLFNRFFDIMILQSNVPSLLINALPLVFQAVIGFIVVSLYHPYFLIFTLVLITLLYMVWAIWGPGAIRTAIEESYAKYDTAHDLEGLAENNDFYHAERNIDAAMTDANERVHRYINANKRHFRRSFSQTVSLLVLYALGSAALLGIGGWLVIQGQLTLGQLVAAELIMSAILVGISQYGTYLDQFYEVCAAVDKLSAFFRIPQEHDPGQLDLPDAPARIEFDSVTTPSRHGEDLHISLDIPPGSNVIVRGCSVPAQRSFLDLLQANRRPTSGWMRIGGEDIQDLSPQKLRSRVIVLDRLDIIECTIDIYLDLFLEEETSRAKKSDVLKLTGLDDTIDRLPDGIDTHVLPSSWPLSFSEILRLKLAGALLARPKVLILSEVFDLVERRYLNPILDEIYRNRDLTLIRFTDDLPRDDDDYALVLHARMQEFTPLSDWARERTQTA